MGTSARVTIARLKTLITQHLFKEAIMTDRAEAVGVDERAAEAERGAARRSRWPGVVLDIVVRMPVLAWPWASLSSNAHLH